MREDHKSKMNIILSKTSIDQLVLLWFREKFLKSKKCKILVVIGIVLGVAIVALLTTTYVIAATATTTSKKRMRNDN